MGNLLEIGGITQLVRMMQAEIEHGGPMITRPTVLILGAGASTHCGYPLGQELINEICSAPPSQLEGYTRTVVEPFVTRLSRSGYRSIDTFLANEPEDQVALGKYLIAVILWRHERLDRLFPPESDGGWYHTLLDSLIGDSRSHFPKNALSIITFNYDRSLEAYLHTAVQNRSDLATANAFLDDLPVVHVHGVLGEYPSIPYGKTTDPDDLLRRSKQIQIIHEFSDMKDRFCNAMFERANTILHDAERIFFLGFGFHDDNMKRLKFFTEDNTRGKEVLSTCFGYEPLERKRLIQRLEQYGLAENVLSRYSCNCNGFFRTTANLE